MSLPLKCLGIPQNQTFLHFFKTFLARSKDFTCFLITQIVLFMLFDQIIREIHMYFCKKKFYSQKLYVYSQNNDFIREI